MNVGYMGVPTGGARGALAHPVIRVGGATPVVGFVINDNDPKSTYSPKFCKNVSLSLKKCKR